MPAVRRLSGLQKDVLSLYRKCLRAVAKKPVEAQPNFYAFARQDFEKNLTLDKKDFSMIEHLLRRGNKQLEMYSSPGIRNVRR